MSKSQTAQRGQAPELGDMTSEEFRRVGHGLIDWVADYFENIEQLPVLAQIEPGELKAQLPTSPPEHGESMDRIVADLFRHLRRHLKFERRRLRHAEIGVEIVLPLRL